MVVALPIYQQEFQFCGFCRSAIKSAIDIFLSIGTILTRLLAEYRSNDDRACGNSDL